MFCLLAWWLCLMFWLFWLLFNNWLFWFGVLIRLFCFLAPWFGLVWFTDLFLLRLISLFVLLILVLYVYVCRCFDCFGLLYFGVVLAPFTFVVFWFDVLVLTCCVCLFACGLLFINSVVMLLVVYFYCILLLIVWLCLYSGLFVVFDSLFAFTSFAFSLRWLLCLFVWFVWCFVLVVCACVWFVSSWCWLAMACLIGFL